MKAYTDLEQSKKLAEILPIESADMEYLLEQWIDEKTYRHKEEYYEIPVVKVDDDCPLQPITLPCWSLAALLEAIREKVGCDLSIWDKGYNIDVYDLESGKAITELYSNPVDAVVETIYKLKEKDLI